VAAGAICLVVAGAIRATLPATEFTLAWQHSVEKTRWEERYRVEGDRLALTEARVQALGAGMEPAPGARLQNGWWTWRPGLAPLPAVTLAASAYGRDYELCWNARCSPMQTLLGGAPAGSAVELRACARPASG
jgi:hypothetical protein